MYHEDDINLDDNDEITKITVRPPVIKFNQTICGVINQSEASDGFNISALVQAQADISIGLDSGANQGANDSLGEAQYLLEYEPVVDDHFIENWFVLSECNRS